MSGLVAALREALGETHVITVPEDLAPYCTDWRGIHNHAALCVVLPANAAQVAAVLRLCAACRVGVVPQGGNTGLVAGGVPVPGRPQIVICLRRMNAILELDPVGDTITVQAGATVQQVQEAAAAAAKLFPVSFGAEGSAQIGGIVATNAGGIQVLSYGSTRAQVLGLEVVLADGRIWNGLRALRKDNTGFDLKQIFIGAEGTLGVITAAVLRLFPAVGARATALLGVESVAASVQVFMALRGAAGQGLTMCEFVTGPAMALGAAHLPGARLPFAAACYLLVELSAAAADAPVLAQLERVLAAALRDGTASDAVIAQSERERLELVRLREAVPEGELAEGGAVKHDIAVPISRIAATVAAVETLRTERFADCRLNIFGHIGDGNLHVNFRPRPGGTLAGLGPRKAAITEAVEAAAMAQGGSFSAEHGIGQMRITGMAAYKSAVELDLMRSVKRALDPHDLLNPGKVLPE